MFEGLVRWLTNDETDESSDSDGEDKLREISLEYDEQELIAATQNFSVSRRLGAGTFGAVYRGTLPDGHEVAVKVMECETDDACGFTQEVLVLSRFRHPNLVTLMGWGAGTTHRFLVYELLVGGDVSNRLKKCRDSGKQFSWDERLRIALDASCGLSHMHNSTPKAFHRDIKSANILIDRNGSAKMADFGLSCIAARQSKLSMTCDRISGTPGYACPLYLRTGRVTERTEVYAFGMVLLELVLNIHPAVVGPGGSICYPIAQIVMPQTPGALDRAISTLDVAARWPHALAQVPVELALQCISSEDGNRPLFQDITQRLRHLCGSFCAGRRELPSGPGSCPAPCPAASAPTMPGPPAPIYGMQVASPTPGLHTRAPLPQGHAAQPPWPSQANLAPAQPPSTPQVSSALEAKVKAKELQLQLKGQVRSLDREIKKKQTEEAKCMRKLEVVQADTQQALDLAKSAVQSRKAVDRLDRCKSSMETIAQQLACSITAMSTKGCVKLAANKVSEAAYVQDLWSTTEQIRSKLAQLIEESSIVDSEVEVEAEAQQVLKEKTLHCMQPPMGAAKTARRELILSR